MTHDMHPDSYVTHLAEATPAIMKARAYNDGVVPEIFASAVVERLLAATGEHFRLNFCRPVIESVLDELDIRGLRLESDDGSAEDLGHLRRDSHLGQLEYTVHERALVDGDSYVMMWPDANGMPRPSTEDALSTVVVYDPRYVTDPVGAAKVWDAPTDADPDRERATIYTAEQIVDWESAPGRRDGERVWRPYARAWREAVPGEQVHVDVNGQPTLEPTGKLGVPHKLVDAYEEGMPVPVWPVPNLFGEVPVAHFRTRLPYGVPEHIDAYAGQNFITKLVVTHANVVEVHGWPQRYYTSGAGLEGEAVDFRDGDDVLVDSDDDGVSASFQAEPGSMWEFPFNSKPGQFEVADPEVFVGPLTFYATIIAALTRTPVSRLLEGRISADSIRESEKPRVAKIKRRRDAFDHSWRRLYGMMLRQYAVAEAVGPEGLQMPWDPDVQAAAATALDDLGPGIEARLQLDWAPIGEDSAADNAEVVFHWGHSASLETKVRRLHPEWTDVQVNEEVQRIRDEQAVLLGTID